MQSAQQAQGRLTALRALMPESGAGDAICAALVRIGMRLTVLATDARQ